MFNFLPCDVYTYNNVLERFGHHGNKHIDHNRDIGDVKRAKKQIANVDGKRVFKRI